jgi:hypothetical protein
VRLNFHRLPNTSLVSTMDQLGVILLMILSARNGWLQGGTTISA